jgi:hypothetical protein
MSLPRFTLALSALLAVAAHGRAATPKEIEAAVQKGAGYLKEQYKGAKPGQLAGGHGVGGAALAGLALLESGTPIDDPAVKGITAAVRDASFGETQTYNVALCLLYLDRLDDPADVPLIQMLGVRLLAGQNSQGGWTYSCIDSVPPADEARLRASFRIVELKAGAGNPAPGGKADPPANPGGNPAKPAAVGKLHSEVEKYAAKLAATRGRDHLDDNSNTQFGVLGVWAARKHGVPVEAALDLIERRFLATQTVNGGWPYSGLLPGGSPSMTCAGLLGLATAIGRREERRLTATVDGHKKDDPAAKPAPKDAKPPAKPADPFFNPPAIPKSDDPFFNPAKPADPPAKNADPKKPAPKPPADARDAAVQRGLALLGQVLHGNAPPQGKGKGRQRFLAGGNLGDRDFYFLWSLERVGVIYGLEKIGGVDWYEFGSDELVAAQHANGSWGKGAGGSEVDTAFALLFLARSNLVRDLSTKVQRDASTTELRAGAGPGSTDPAPAPTPAPMPKPPAPADPPPAVVVKPMAPTTPPTPVPAPAAPTSEDAKTVAAELVAVADADWDKALAKVRDAKGAAYTQALVLAAKCLDGDRLKAARAALAERLTRMTGETLRTMAKAEEAELRRAAALAMAMKDDKTHLPDLIAALLDDEDTVVRAAKAGLKSLTGQDFGPAPGANLADRTAAAKAWLEWLRKQK